MISGCVVYLNCSDSVNGMCNNITTPTEIMFAGNISNKSCVESHFSNIEFHNKILM